MRVPKYRIVLLGWLLLVCAHAQDQVQQHIIIAIVDENGVPVPGARIVLTTSDGSPSLRCQTGTAGICALPVTGAGPFNARVEKENFYAAEAGDLHFDRISSIELMLVHQREVREVVDVVDSRPAINPEQINAQEQISGVDVMNLPYPVTRDYRNVLNYIPQVVNDLYRQPHITGAETYQTLVLFDGFNVTQPANGQLLLRVSTDAFRSINVQTSRVSAQYGKASGGVLELNTATGDDHFRFAVTDFIPSVQNRKGPIFDKVNPRFTFSGPISKGRVWFLEAADAEYDNIIEKQLLPDMNHDVYWRVGNLFKVQGNVSARNIFTSSFNYNYAHDQHAGMSRQNPPNTTPAVSEPMYQASLKDQYYFSSGQLLETGLGFNRYDLDQVPRRVVDVEDLGGILALRHVPVSQSPARGLRGAVHLERRRLQRKRRCDARAAVMVVPTGEREVRHAGRRRRVIPVRDRDVVGGTAGGAGVGVEQAVDLRVVPGLAVWIGKVFRKVERSQAARNIRLRGIVAGDAVRRAVGKEHDHPEP